MTPEVVAALIMGGAGALGGVLALISNLRANRTSEKKLTFEEREAEEQRHRSISEERRKELDRLYERVDKLEQIVQQLQESDRKKQRTINEQADELERTKQSLSDVRDLFARFVERVQTAWRDGHPMPVLTEEERAVLEDTRPRWALNQIKEQKQ